MLYDVQILKSELGEWQWAGVEPGKGQSYSTCRREMLRMQTDHYWVDVIGVIAFRVRAIPGAPKVPGPREITRAAVADMQRAVADLEKAIRERDEARAQADQWASAQGVAIDWDS